MEAGGQGKEGGGEGRGKVVGGEREVVGRLEAGRAKRLQGNTPLWMKVFLGE